MSASTPHTTDSFGTDDEHDSSQPRVRRSKVWQYFEQDLVMVDDVWKAVCKYCGLRLGFNWALVVLEVILLQLAQLLGMMIEIVF